jgi:peptidyl-prolyl cis-trans isomerase B (cyclophilin B)
LAISLWGCPGTNFKASLPFQRAAHRISRRHGILLYVRRKKMKKIILLSALCLCLFLDTSAVLCEDERSRAFTEKEIEEMRETTARLHTKFGDITLRFFPEVAPNHVSNFLALSRKGFYDGTTFHRVVPGFVIQGGDPNSKSRQRSSHGLGGPGYHIKAEFNEKPHKRGTLSMARSRHPDSAGSQFFICVADTPFLNGKYTVFGEVASGMGVVDRIASQPRDRRDNPHERVEMSIEVQKLQDTGK